jgi:uncharacterized protein (TIGR03437 family)
MIHIRQINRSLGMLALAGLAALVIPANCLAQGYTITTVAGNQTTGNYGDGGPATSAFMEPYGVAVDSAGNLYIADLAFNVVRKVTPSGTISTVAGNAALGGGYSGDGGPATSAQLRTPEGLALDSAGNLYVADTYSNRVRKVAANGTITTVAGGGSADFPPYGDGGLATQATLAQPAGVAMDTAGHLYIADYGDLAVRKVALDGTITTVAGGIYASIYGVGDGNPATSASVFPIAVAVDGAGNLFFADATHGRIRKVSTNGIISTLAGNGSAGYSGDGGPASSAGLGSPVGVAVDSAGNVYIADTNDDRVRMVSPGGTITTIAGNGSVGYSGDNGPATSAQLHWPYGIAVGTGGRIYFADALNGVVRMLTPTASTSTPVISSGGIVTASAFGAFPSVAPGSWIEIYGANLASDSRSWTGADFTGINAPTSLDGTKVTIGGQAAFIDYISPTQVNAQVPSNVATGSQPLIVTSAAGASAASTITVNQQQPGLLAPSSFLVGGKQYVVAMFGDGVTYVLPPGAIAGVPSRRAQPGDNITLYGVGFGPVTPNTPAGQVVQQTNTLTGVLHLLFGQTQAVVGYDGLAPNAIGLYQFNVTVPNIAASDTVPLTFTLGGVAGTQTLYIAVQN